MHVHTYMQVCLISIWDYVICTSEEESGSLMRKSYQWTQYLWDEETEFPDKEMVSRDGVFIFVSDIFHMFSVHPSQVPHFLRIIRVFINGFRFVALTLQQIPVSPGIRQSRQETVTLQGVLWCQPVDHRHEGESDGRVKMVTVIHTPTVGVL